MSLKGCARKLGLGEKIEGLAQRIEQLNSDGEANRWRFKSETPVV